MTADDHLPRASTSTIRRATTSDVSTILSLIRVHAEFERTRAVVTAHALRDALSASAPLVQVWVAEVDDDIVGYATATTDFSTWSGRQFVHVDCLFVRADHRGRGAGARLLAAICDHTERIGLTDLQWQTPVWNEEACRFYRRMGATASPKMRFALVVGEDATPATSYDFRGNYGA